MKKYAIGLALWGLSLGLVAAQSATTNLPLDQAIQLALKNNKGIKLADTRTQAAQARAQEAKDRGLPQANVFVNYPSRPDQLYNVVIRIGNRIDQLLTVALGV